MSTASIILLILVGIGIDYVLCIVSTKYNIFKLWLALFNERSYNKQINTCKEELKRYEKLKKDIKYYIGDKK